MLELLKVFNSRTCQLVLGAGAMQVGPRCTLGTGMLLPQREEKMAAYVAASLCQSCNVWVE